MAESDELDFQKAINDILDIPGVSKKKIADWAGVDPSTVTRWHQGAKPTDPGTILKRLQPHVDRAREEVSSVRRTELESWGPLIGDLDAGIRDYVEQTGLLAGMYTVVASWIPTSLGANEYDVVILRHFDRVWADMERRIYNVGDQSQIVSFSESEEEDGPTFDQGMALGDVVNIKIKVDKEVGKSVARLHIQLNLEDMPYSNSSVGFIDGFGYRFRATRAIVAKRLYPGQTNDFLGATIPVPCRRLNLLACVPRSCLRGSPSALSSSNRSMLKSLMELDNTPPDVIESLLWPRGRRYELSTTPDAPLKQLVRVNSTLEALPHSLQEALKQPADLSRSDVSLRDVLCSPDSTCFLLDLHAPHPSLTCNIVWRLPPLAAAGE